MRPAPLRLLGQRGTEAIMSKRHKLYLAAITALTLAGGAVTGSSPALAQSHEQKPVREIEIIVDGAYKPNRIEVHEGERVRLKFVRKEYNPCTSEVVFPKQNIRRELPPNLPVVIELPALAPGEYEFKCGMNMIRGTLVVTAHSHH
jgi:plastocyanin domain-containing protein